MSTILRFPSYQIPGFTIDQNAVYSRNLFEVEAGWSTNEGRLSALETQLPAQIQRGSIETTFVSASASTGTVNLSTAFATTAILVFLQPMEPSNFDLVPTVRARTSNSFEWRLAQRDGTTISGPVTLMYQVMTT